MAELSPMMKQYFEIKKDYGDTILCLLYTSDAADE